MARINCPKCGRAFRGKGGLRWHLENAHRTSPQPPTPNIGAEGGRPTHSSETRQEGQITKSSMNEKKVRMQVMLTPEQKRRVREIARSLSLNSLSLNGRYVSEGEVIRRALDEYIQAWDSSQHLNNL
jgi:hypothetical protein